MRMRCDEDARRGYLDAIVFSSNRVQKAGVKFVDPVESATAKIGCNPIRFRELKAGIRRAVACHASLLDSLPSGQRRNCNPRRQNTAEEIPIIGVTARTVDGSCREARFFHSTIDPNGGFTEQV